MLLDYDVIGLAAHLTNLVTNQDLYGKLISCKNEGAQHLLDLLQAVC
jgi:hypothetical protein